MVMSSRFGVQQVNETVNEIIWFECTMSTQRTRDKANEALENPYAVWVNMKNKG